MIPKLDRLGRSAGHLATTVDRLRALGVRLVSLGEHLDSETPMGRAMVRMMATMTELESDMIGSGWRASPLRALPRARRTGRAPFGYRQAGKEGLVEDPAEAAVVRRIFREYVAGKSQREIGRDLNREGLRPQRAAEWNQGSISKLLANPVYAGRVRVSGDGVRRSARGAGGGRGVAEGGAAEGGRGEAPSRQDPDGEPRPRRRMLLYQARLSGEKAGGVVSLASGPFQVLP